ncbi:hypothetical protein RIEGSTA812A_PEG_366 [invertebrate metagenome]|uniref:Uncharacterized protein n=1 Tax=invertebrate metagenome TaxID=1711999 RepID=A0A484H862_9ZZZZ
MVQVLYGFVQTHRNGTRDRGKTNHYILRVDLSAFAPAAHTLDVYTRQPERAIPGFELDLRLFVDRAAH